MMSYNNITGRRVWKKGMFVFMLILSFDFDAQM
jgi:hypothetical protein